jgi:hypothetical protein
VLEDVAAGLTPEHCARIGAALPPSVVMTPEAWVELNEIVVGYHVYQTRHASYPIGAERKRWRRLSRSVEAAAVELRRLRRETLWTDPDPLWPNRALTVLLDLHRKIETRAAFHDIWRAFGRRQNPHREFLYWGVMRVWTDRLGGELRYSTKGSTHYGPLIRFFVACVEPILEEQAPRISAIADIIEREIANREWTAAQKERWLSQP